MMKAEKTIRNHIEEIRQQKIIAASRFFFKQKNYASHKVWDVRKENDGSALLTNYYFNNKQKVLQKVIVQNTIMLFNVLAPVLNSREKTVIQKIEFIVLAYIDLLLEKPDFAAFILNELLSDSSKIDVIAIKREYLLNSYFMMQILELKKESKNKFNPVQQILNLIGMILLPLATVKRFANSEITENRRYLVLLEERKKMLPLWTSCMFQQ
ncbi:transcriptional repressor BetI [Flavobacterium hibernum]|nr:transcriptional repressor BetI [Flavobacterium hibernum]